MSDMTTCINTSLDCFPVSTVTLDIESTLIKLVYYVGITDLFTGSTVSTMPSLHILGMYIKHDCINCLHQRYMTSKHCIAPLKTNKLINFAPVNFS